MAHSKPEVVHRCTCSEFHSLEAAATDFWNTPNGILRRIDGLAQDLHFSLANEAFKMVAPANGVQWLRWVTAEYDRVCQICLKNSQGGNNGHYRVGGFMPKMPVHKFDRCQWQLIFGEP